MLCEMCGKEVAMTSRVKVEGSVLRVGPECAHFGKPLDPPATPAATGGAAPPTRYGGGASRATSGPRRMEERDLYTEIGEMELASDWPKRIRVAREALKWTPEDLAKRLNEKKSVVLKLEAGGIHPPDDLVRRVERLLKVRLRAEPGAT
jgi:putative transcription factor